MARDVHRNLQIAQPVQSSGSKLISPVASAYVGPRREVEGAVAAPQVLPEHGKDLHDLNLMKSADEIASIAKIRVHCQ